MKPASQEARPLERSRASLITSTCTGRHSSTLYSLAKAWGSTAKAAQINFSRRSVDCLSTGARLGGVIRRSLGSGARCLFLPNFPELAVDRMTSIPQAGAKMNRTICPRTSLSMCNFGEWCLAWLAQTIVQLVWGSRPRSVRQDQQLHSLSTGC